MTTTTTLDQATDFHALDDVLAFHAQTGRIRFNKGSLKRTMNLDSSAAATAADDDVPDLAGQLSQQKKAPSSTAIAAVPAGISDEDRQNLEDILLLNSYISVAATRYLYNKKPDGWDITNPAQAADFTRQMANAKFRILTQGLGSFMTLESATARQFHQSQTSADLHLSFLGTLFGGFGFPASTMKQLDSVLTSVTQTLSDLRLSWSDQSSTLDHLVFLYYFEPVTGLDNAKLPRMRLFYLHIDQSSWTASVGKSSIAHFEFNMNFDDNIFDMAPTQVASNRQNIQNLISTMTGQSFDDINALLSPKAVRGA